MVNVLQTRVLEHGGSLTNQIEMNDEHSGKRRKLCGENFLIGAHMDFIK